jgi:hypothetical protein
MAVTFAMFRFWSQFAGGKTDMPTKPGHKATNGGCKTCLLTITAEQPLQFVAGGIGPESLNSILGGSETALAAEPNEYGSRYEDPQSSQRHQLGVSLPSFPG